MELTEKDLIKNAFDEGWELGRQEAIFELSQVQADIQHEAEVDELYERMMADFGPEDKDV